MKLAQAGIGLILSATLATGAEDDSSCTGEPYSISFYSEKTRGLATIHRFRYEGKIQSRKQKSIYCKPDPAVMEFAGPMSHVRLTDLDDDGKIDIVNIYFADGTKEYRRSTLAPEHRVMFDSYQDFYSKARLASLMMFDLSP